MDNNEINFSKRQKEIISTAIKLIAEHGIQQLTVKEIAMQIGISEPAIYRHFKSKFDILKGMLSYFKRKMTMIIDNSSADKMPAIKKIENMIAGHFSFFNENPSFAAVIFTEEFFQNDKQLSLEVYDIMKLKEKEIFKIMKLGKKDGTILIDIPLDIAVLHIMGPIRLLVKKWYLSGYSTDIIKDGKKLTESILKILKL